MSTGSLQARPKNEMPTGRPKTNPIGTVMWGYPAMAAGVELPPTSWSPSTWSVRNAGPPVGATRASNLNCSITASIPCRAHQILASVERVQVFLAVERSLTLGFNKQVLAEKGHFFLRVLLVERDDLLQRVHRGGVAEQREIRVEVRLQLVEQHG